MTTLDDRPTTGVDPGAAARGELRERELLQRDAYAFGYSDGYEAGLRAAHAEMATWWAELGRSVRATAERLKGTVPEPVTRSTGWSDASIWFTAEEFETWAGGA